MSSTDPFRVLRAADSPADPDPEFARRLREDVARALASTETDTDDRSTRGATMTATVPVTVPVTDDDVTATRTEPVPAAVPYLAVDGARAAIAWYVDVFGAEVVGDPYVMDDDRIGHAELRIGAGVVYLSDAYPEIGVTAPTRGDNDVSLMLPVDDADAVRERAMAAGATGDRPPYDGHGDRNAWIVDPFGHRWGLHSPLPVAGGSQPRYAHGDIGYVSLQVADTDRAAAFYRTVLGWSIPVGGRHVAGNTVPSIGMFPSTGRPTLFCCYAVDDIEAAVATIRAAGGSADEPQDAPHGRTADATDPLGTAFAVFQNTANGERIPTNGRSAGDLSYLTLQVTDSAVAREFYGRVLGWTYEPGRVDDGWQVDDARPMTGLAGGNDEGGAVPMWLTDDLDTAVQRVRAEGGTATDPETQPYGRMSTCSDDQGLEFYLGEI